MTDVHTFVPRREQARGDSLIGALAAAVLIILILYAGKGERDWRLILGLAAVGAALVLSGFWVRTRFHWVDEIRLSAEAATLVRDGREQTLPWTAVRSVRYLTSGGEQWILSTHRGHLPMTIRGDGLSREETARLGELIPALHAAATAGADAPPQGR